MHALATPLITKPDGTKYGKTEGGAIWLSADLMSPYAFYQFWLNATDAEVPACCACSASSRGRRSRSWRREHAERPAARIGQRALAEEVTTLVHGADETGRAIAASRALFGQGSPDRSRRAHAGRGGRRGQGGRDPAQPGASLRSPT